MRVEDLIGDAQTVFNLFNVGADANALLEGHRVAVFHPGIHHRPDVAGRFHLAIAVIKLVEQRFAGNLKVAEIVAVPHHAHHIDVVERNGDFNFSRKAGIGQHPLLLLVDLWQLPEIEKIKPVERRHERVMLQPLRIAVNGLL